jgi:RNA polymerase sigma-70 factor (ECF subfamily)
VDCLAAAPAHVVGEFLKVRPRLRVYALSLTQDPDRADDLVQDAFVRAVEHADQYQPGTNFAGWIFRVLRNHYLDQRRRPKNRAHEDIHEVRLATPQRQEDRIRFRELVALLRLLPKRNRLVLLMHGLDGMTLEEIAVQTDVELGTVKSRISRARDLLDGAL